MAAKFRQQNTTLDPTHLVNKLLIAARIIYFVTVKF